MPVLDPLLSEFWNEGQSEFWWLLNSGASGIVMATSSVNAYGAWVADMRSTNSVVLPTGVGLTLMVLQQSLFGSVFTMDETRIGYLTTNLPSSVAFGASFRFKLPVAEHTCCRGECW